MLSHDDRDKLLVADVQGAGTNEDVYVRIELTQDPSSSVMDV